MTRAELYDALRELMLDDDEHFYLSTGCLHGVHEHCNSSVSITGGSKVPGVCKWCPGLCVCPCHTHE